MAKTVISTDAAPKSLASYSQGIKSGGFIFVAGQGPFDPASGAVVGATIQEQTTQALKNVEAVLKAGGSSLDRVVSVTVILAEPDDFAGVNEEWGKWFPVDPPARQVAKMGIERPGLKISIAAIAEA